MLATPVSSPSQGLVFRVSTPGPVFSKPPSWRRFAEAARRGSGAAGAPPADRRSARRRSPPVANRRVHRDLLVEFMSISYPVSRFQTPTPVFPERRRRRDVLDRLAPVRLPPAWLRAEHLRGSLLRTSTAGSTGREAGSSRGFRRCPFLPAGSPRRGRYTGSRPACGPPERASMRVACRPGCCPPTDTGLALR